MKRTNENSQVSKENYSDDFSNVEYGMSRASDEELKKRRTLNVTGAKKWNTSSSSPGSTISTKSTNTNPFSRVHISSSVASSGNNAFANVKLGNASATSTPAKPFNLFGSEKTPLASENPSVSKGDANYRKKIAVLEDINDMYDNFKGDPEEFDDIVEKSIKMQEELGWATYVVKKAASREEQTKSVSVDSCSKEPEKTTKDEVKPVTSIVAFSETTNNNNDGSSKEIYSVKSKAYKDSIPGTGWKDFGAGTLKLLHNTQTNKYQLLVREEILGRPLINIPIAKGMKITKQKNFVMLVSVMDEDVGRESFMFKVNLANVDTLVGHLNDIVD